MLCKSINWFLTFNGLNNLNFNNYSFEFTPTETTPTPTGTLLFIANHLSYRCHNDLNICKKNELKSNFVENVNRRKSNIFVGIIYRHTFVDLTDLIAIT